jgi:succinate dehydrogenase / fumarate reductase flavoprotein subunit
VTRVETAEADVLVIGGGAAGVWAALKAQEEGARVTMIVKGVLGKSGCSIFASHLPWYDETTEEKKKARLTYAIRYYNHYLTDQHYVIRLGQFVRERFFGELERLGVYWRRDDAGNIVVSKSLVPVCVAHKQGSSGLVIMERLRQEVLRRGIPVMEETCATGLLVEDGTCRGAVAVRLRDGAAVVVTSKAVVLATGHADYLSLRSTGTREQSADGISMAMRAGCELVNMEICWFHATDVSYPRAWMRLHVYPNPLVGTEETSRMYNSAGEVFFEQKRDAPGSSAPYVQQMRRLALQVERGLARWDGGYYSGYTHIDPEVLRAYQHQIGVWNKLGLDVTRDLLECAITWHMRQGGIHLDTRTMMAVGVEGLYVAGGLGGHYLGGLGPATYDGWVAGTMAAEYARRAKKAGATQIGEGELAKREIMRVTGLLQKVGTERPYWPALVKREIRRVMWEEMGFVKSETSIRRASERLGRIRQEMVPRMGLRYLGDRWNFEWVEALDVLSMLDACEATVCGALERKESRGPFYRSDFPYVDNENWLVKLIQDWREGRPSFRKEYYETPFLKPEREREGYFDADY